MGGLIMSDSAPQKAAKRAASPKKSPGSEAPVALKPAADAMNLVLIGMMGSGKSTVGRLCAEALGMKFVDTDAVIEEREGAAIPEIFKTKGEEAFRELERSVVKEFAEKTGQVIATGGGTVLDSESATALARTGFIVWLQASPEAILRRTGDASNRPLLASAKYPLKKISALIVQREEHYKRVASVFISTEMDSRFEITMSIEENLSPDKPVAEIVELLAERFLKEEKRRIEINEKMRTVDVALEERSYRIHISPKLIDSNGCGKLILNAAPCTSACIITHPALMRYVQHLARDLQRLGVRVSIGTIPPGEHIKNLRMVNFVYGCFAEAKLDRKSLVIAVGGGVLGDIVGFAAATYLRGIQYAQVPTTLLSQVDSSVGGKTGVDMPEGKNLVGAFHQPKCVLIDPSVLLSLPLRELRSGMAEVIKYGIIYDKAFFEEIGLLLPKIMKHDEESLIAVIARSCEIKAEVVSQDETEQGLRAILNFGHTIGHALEAVTKYKRFKHGEAISIGMVSAALIGEELGVTPPETTRAICKLLEAAKLPTAFPPEIENDPILEAALLDKKTEGGKLNFVLASEIGSVSVYKGAPVEIVRAALDRHKAGTFADV